MPTSSKYVYTTYSFIIYFTFYWTYQGRIRDVPGNVSGTCQGQFRDDVNGVVSFILHSSQHEIMSSIPTEYDGVVKGFL